MHSVDQTTVSDTKASTMLADYADPIVFYCYALISTESATNMDLIVSKFPTEMANFVEKALIQLEADELIIFDEGRYKPTAMHIFNKIDKSTQAEMLPNLIKGAAQTVVNDIDSGAFVKKSEDINLFYVSDNSQTRARIKALVANFNREMKSIVETSNSQESNGVRLVAIVNSLPTTEVLL